MEPIPKMQSYWSHSRKMAIFGHGQMWLNMGLIRILGGDNFTSRIKF